jgi:hypothetical protein
MKNLGIVDGDDAIGMDDDAIGMDDVTIMGSEKNNEFSTFMNDVYLNCKKLEITPSSIFSWIKDLIDCQLNLDSNIATYFSLRAG